MSFYPGRKIFCTVHDLGRHAEVHSFEEQLADRAPSDSRRRGVRCRVAGATQLGAKRFELRCARKPYRRPAEPRGDVPNQNPSLRLSSSLTACGLALPPDAFITWPTNQPISLRLGFRLRDLVGIGGDDLVHHLLDRADVGDLLHAALLDDGARVAAFAPDDLEQVLGDLAGDRAVRDQVEDRAELVGADRGLAMSLPSLLSRPNSSLITQLAAALASRPFATASK